MPSPIPNTVTYEPLREVRLAVVIYGGVSLAIYINGIAQELLSLVRATAPRTLAPKERAPLLDEASLKNGRKTSETVYRKLGQLLGDPDADPRTRWQAIKNGEAVPIRTRFVVDVLSGTSAGGINAVFLAKALATQNLMKDLQQLWERKGDIETLINDKNSLTSRLTRQRPPQSLLNSHRMYQELLDALDTMQVDEAGLRSPLVDRLDLFSTTTDIHGLVLPITLADGVVHERRHKNVFHFRHVSSEPTQSHFSNADNPFLAYAARCTSAFPFAFEPMALCDIFPILRASALHADKTYCDPDTTQWQKYYEDYIGGRSGIPKSQPFHLRPFGDGGYLDNKPFSHAIDALLKRHADLPVDRKLIYIEPSPEHFSADRVNASRPDAIENSLAALLTLPRYETIRQDLEQIVERNRQIERINRVINQVKNQLQAPDSGIAPERWLRMDDQEYGSGYATYERLKVTTVTDDLADALSAAYHIDVRSALGSAVRIIANVWRELESPERQDRRQFLLDFDVEYRLRRIRHVWREINQAYAAETIPAEQRANYRQALHEIKDSLGEPYLRLQKLLEAPIPTSDGAEPLLTDRQLRFVAAPPRDPDAWPRLSDYRHAMERTERGSVERAAYLLQREGRKKALSDVAGRIRDTFVPELKACSPLVRNAFATKDLSADGANEARQRIQKAFDDFDRYDSAAFPITFGTTVGECDHIDIHRISPEDATGLNAVLEGRPKLRGQALGAFGAFLDRSWRRNDILWGRLDGAERLITMMLPGDDETLTRIRRELIDEAHENIVLEFLDRPAGTLTPWRQQLKTFVQDVRDEPAPELVARSAARATAVTGELLEGIVDARRVPGQKFFRRLAIAGRFLWQFVEVSVPRSPLELLADYWSQLTLLFAAALMLLAVLGFIPIRFAAVVFGAAVGASIARHLLRRYLRGDLVVSTPTTMVATAGMAVLLAVVVHRMPQWVPAVETEARLAGNAISTVWASRSGGVNRELLAAWLRSLAIGCGLVTVASGIILMRIQARFPRRPGGLRLLLGLQLARYWRDVYTAVGTYDLEARSAAAKATRADIGFAAAYSTLLAAVGLLLAVQEGWLGSLAAVLGVAAGVLDEFENTATLRTLLAMNNAALPAGNEPLSTSPFPFAVGKWIALAGAVGLLAYLFLR